MSLLPISRLISPVPCVLWEMAQLCNDFLQTVYPSNSEAWRKNKRFLLWEVSHVKESWRGSASIQTAGRGICLDAPMFTRNVGLKQLRPYFTKKKHNTIFLLFSRRQGYWKLVSSKASILMTNLSCSIYIWPQLIFSKCNNKWQKHFKKSNWLLKSTCFYSTLAPWFGFRAKHVDW